MRLEIPVAVILAALALPTSGATLTGRVVRVADGDTVTVLVAGKRESIRLQGIDAPELGQPFGQASRRSLAGQVAGKVIRVHASKRDAYDRLVGVVLAPFPKEACTAKPCPEWVDAGYLQVARGMAWHFKRFDAEQSPRIRSMYARAESQAKAKRRGLWQQPDAMAPWAWRDSRREPRSTSSPTSSFIAPLLDLFKPSAAAAQGPAPATASGWCAVHRYCRQMLSCSQARRAMTECGWSSLDGDDDGVPCETLCR